jgi:hypothetical protein
VLKRFVSEVGNRCLRLALSYAPDAAYLALSHRRRIGRFPNIRHPKTYNEMILDRCLHPDPRWSQLTDKISVRDYVRDKIGEKHLIPLIAAPDTFTQEVFDSLPDSFVMKANHGSGLVKIVHDKSTTTFGELSEIARRWLTVDYYKIGRERHYRAIKPRIFFEKLLLDPAGAIPADFKMHMFGFDANGPIINTLIINDRFGNARGDVYDANWNPLQVGIGAYPRSRTIEPPPAKWKEVVDVAMRLVEGLGFVRVDLYVVGDDIYFGELTFTPGAGVLPLAPDRFDYEWGCLFEATEHDARLGAPRLASCK